MEHNPLPFDEFARLYESVSKLPEVLNFSEFSQAVQANSPSRLENSDREVSVLLSISVTADGGLAGVRAILPELPPGVVVHGIREDESGNYLGSIPSLCPTPSAWPLPNERLLYCGLRQPRRTANLSYFQTIELVWDSRPVPRAALTASNNALPRQALRAFRPSGNSAMLSR